VGLWLFCRNVGAGYVPDLSGTSIDASTNLFGGAFGQAVALSGDGNTAIVGAPIANEVVGQIYIYLPDTGVSNTSMD